MVSSLSILGLALGWANGAEGQRQSAECTLMTEIQVSPLQGKFLPHSPSNIIWSPSLLKPLQAALSLVLAAQHFRHLSTSSPCQVWEPSLEATRLTSDKPQGAAWKPAPMPEGASLPNI